MNSIIVATDFSQAAQHAADYAAQLATHLGTSLHLFHAFSIPFTYTENPLPLISLDELTNISETEIVSEKARLNTAFPRLPISHSVHPGEIMDCLTEAVENNNPLLVVVGSSGAGGNNLLWGSVAVQALRHLPVAVLAIPMHTKWKPVQTICLSADYKNVNNHFPFETIRKWVDIMQASLDVVHISQSGVNATPDGYFQSELSSVTPQYHTISNAKLGDGVAEFLKEHNPDWLLIIPQKHGFFESLFRRSRTEILTKVSHVPVLALH